MGIWKPLANEVDPGPIEPNPSKELVDFDGNGIYRSPEFSWFNPVSPTAVKFLNTDKLGKEYQNDLFVVDFNIGNIYRFDLNQNRTGLLLTDRLADKVANNIAENQLSVFARNFGGITDLQVGPDGYLYIVSIGQGKVYRIGPYRHHIIVIIKKYYRL